MGVSTDGILCYGIMLEDEGTFPWDGQKYEGDIETWWREIVCGYKPPFQMYDAHGEWLNGVKPPEDKISEYYDHQRAFSELHPLPFDLVTHCSYDCPMYILAAKDTKITAWRGHPVVINPDLLVEPDNAENDLLAFIEKYDIPIDEEHPEAHWYLCSLWG